MAIQKPGPLVGLLTCPECPRAFIVVGNWVRLLMCEAIIAIVLGTFPHGGRRRSCGDESPCCLGVIEGG